MSAARAAFLCLAAAAGLVAQESAVLLQEGFDEPLSASRWEAVRVHDTQADVIEAREGKLLLGLDTLGTADETVKLRGIRSRQAFELSERAGLRVEATLDWNAQENGCYLTLGFALVPDGIADPRSATEALAFELVGVPPGKNVRPALWQREKNALRPLWSDGWPQERREDRVGRAPRPVKVVLELQGARLRLLEDGAERWSGGASLRGRVRVLLFVTGHSNYGLRRVHVDDLRVERMKEGE